MIAYPPPLKAVGGARTGIAPANLLDVQDVNGNLYYWSDRPINAPVAITGAIAGYGVPPIPPNPGQSVAWAYPSLVNGVAYTFVELDSLNNGVICDSISQMAINGSVRAQVQFLEGGPLEPPYAVMFSQFTPPSLPAGAVIDAVVPVLRMPVISITLSGYISSPGADFSLPSGEADGQFYAIDFTPTLAAVEAANFGVQLDDTLESTSGGYAVVNFVGIAIYYHGGTGAPGWGYPGEAPYGVGPYIPWLVQVPSFTFHRSLVTDVGAFVIQNLSGDTLSRNFEKIARRSALEGAMFVYRLWQADAQAAWLEVHGTLSVQGIGVDTVKLKGSQLLNESQEDTPLEIYCETCQLQWGGRRCGSTESTECQYSFQTCQVVERPMLTLNNFEKNYGETAANTVLNVINRRRVI